MRPSFFPAALLSAALLLSLGACEKYGPADEIHVTGVLATQGITTYQYGSHVIANDESFYALRSDVVDLDAHVGDTVTVTGYLLTGYPVDGGPLYLEVERIR